MRAYGKELAVSDFKIVYCGREFAILGCTCSRCGYAWFVPALPEHEPSYCPNCAMKFVGAVQGERKK